MTHLKSSALGKRVVTGAILLVLLLETVEWHRGLSRFTAARWVRFGLLALLGCLWRNNGLYVVVPSLIAFLLLGRLLALCPVHSSLRWVFYFYKEVEKWIR